jgi:transcriptional regulator with XRE-family HTH domain
MTISQRIFELLKEKNKQQKDLAAYAGISASAISDWKKKGTNPSAEYIFPIAQFLGVSVEYLLTGNETAYDLSETEQRLLRLFACLTPTQQGELIGRAAILSEQNEAEFQRKESV